MCIHFCIIVLFSPAAVALTGLRSHAAGITQPVMITSMQDPPPIYGRTTVMEVLVQLPYTPKNILDDYSIISTPQTSKVCPHHHPSNQPPPLEAIFCQFAKSYYGRLGDYYPLEYTYTTTSRAIANQHRLLNQSDGYHR